MTTVWVNGCFDVLHIGHIALLEYASCQGSKLIVGLDTDERVKSSKGIQRPINSLAKRMKLISAIRYVNDVTFFGSDEELLKRIKDSGASLIVVGNDYEGKRVIGSEILPVKFFTKLEGLSSTEVINALCV
jgi:D-beta-D-heptose 7-phosphate kinase/D-beta-D-heptose 1-phosphate adenosyltransferase